jgi:hypothetical protein
MEFLPMENPEETDKLPTRWYNLENGSCTQMTKSRRFSATKICVDKWKTFTMKITRLLGDSFFKLRIRFYLRLSDFSVSSLLFPG